MLLAVIRNVPGHPIFTELHLCNRVTNKMFCNSVRFLFGLHSVIHFCVQRQHLAPSFVGEFVN